MGASAVEEGGEGDDVAPVHVRIAPPVQVRSGSCQEAVAGGGQARSLQSTIARPVVHDLRLRPGRDNTVVPRGAHQIVQSSVEVPLTKRDHACPRARSTSMPPRPAAGDRTGPPSSLPQAAAACPEQRGMDVEGPDCPAGEERRIQMPVAVSPEQRGAAGSPRCPSAAHRRARLPATTGPTRSGERVR
jgi:hypothetical protein